MHMLPLLLLTACPDGDDTGSLCGEITLTDASNYSFEGTVDPPVFETASGVDIEICWPDMVKDIQCHDLDPAEDIDLASLVRFTHLTQADVADALSRNDLQQADISGYVAAETGGGTCTNLSDMSFFGTPVDVASEYTSDGGTYLLTLITGTSPRVGARMLSFLQPTDTSDVTRIYIQSGCDVLQFDADLQSLAPPGVCADGPWTVTWGDLTTDGHGNPIDLLTVDSVSLGFYGGFTAAELETRFLDLETLATTTWTGDLDGEEQVDLSTLTADGVAFDGFSSAGSDGIWVFALRCSTCSNPAPVYLTLLEPQ